MRQVSSAIHLWSDIYEKLGSWQGVASEDDTLGLFEDSVTVDVEFLHRIKDENILLVLDGSESLIGGGALKQVREL